MPRVRLTFSLSSQLVCPIDLSLGASSTQRQLHGARGVGGIIIKGILVDSMKCF